MNNLRTGPVIKLNKINIKPITKLIAITFLFISFIISNSLAQLPPITTDSRIKTLVYNPNEVYQLKFHYGYQSFIEFSDDEDIEMISIGEAFAWRLTPAGKRMFIRPLEIGAHTNMTIITNKRTYQFDILSAEYDGRADDELVYTVRFYYPEAGALIPIPPQLSKPRTVSPQNLPPLMAQPLTSVVKTPIPSQFVEKSLTPEVYFKKGEERKLNFLYSIAGKSENLIPLKVYDDGKETFFQFKDKNQSVPNISLVDNFGVEKPVGYAIREGFIAIPTVANQFTLRLGNGLICVFNEKNIAGPEKSRVNLYEKIK